MVAIALNIVLAKAKPSLPIGQVLALATDPSGVRML